MKRCLIIFAKEPKKGKVKTRLSKYLSQYDCLRLYKAFLRDTIDMAKGIGCEQRIMAYVSDAGNPRYLKKIARHFLFYRQEGKGLGRRMHNAFKFARKYSASKSVIIGADSPTLPSSFIKKAFRQLDRNDIVVGPSHDGGYYLIGLKEPYFELFKGIKWSSDKVLDETIKSSKRFKKKIAMLDRWYDVDEIESLNYLKHDLKRRRNRNIARWTRKLLTSKRYLTRPIEY